MIWVSKLKEVTRIMNMKLRHHCTFVYMYTNNLTKVYRKPLFDNKFSFQTESKPSYFCQMIKCSIEKHFST